MIFITGFIEFLECRMPSIFDLLHSARSNKKISLSRVFTYIKIDYS
jgi:hypothetical protein